ncbi:GrpB family protein [Priestia endophytica]|uniref:GrpB family protein n=1 Tax=Priestia endophytica TaxID=135735 RepID=UPI0022816DB1|nr:GrpB family protein [Priestia endophytica]MCY8232498.1 GrpB family protein [Priestia endophytica]
MEEKVYFQAEYVFREAAETLFLEEKAKLKVLLSHAEIHHVGSTAIPGSLTKGDVDIQVIVNQEDFNSAKEILVKYYDINSGSVSDDTFISFKDDNRNPPLGIQLTVRNSSLDIFWKITDVLRENENLRQQYNQIKREFNGESMEKYREAKARFFINLMKTKAYKNK